MAPYEWVYNAGSSWAPLDQYTQSKIESLWFSHGACWIASPSFGGTTVYVDTADLILMCSGYAYTIAR
ncbi:hypothetical protein BCR43DRAFT_418181, partial [Syncephalastrum racemosum]